ncbi:hypothetical protein Y032_0776g2261 [Ancylostoma ceylanicum]|nr:hypothetical protein Y032_0776g2261 [Ancylostoma ceylanicum]
MHFATLLPPASLASKPLAQPCYRGAVYLITCRGCGQKYVGETVRPLNQRLMSTAEHFTIRAHTRRTVSSEIEPSSTHKNVHQISRLRFSTAS